MKAIYSLFFPALVFLLKTFIPKRSSLYRHIAIRDEINLDFEFNKPIWLHASSVGEYEQAREVILEIKESSPGQQVICSVYSASAWEQRKDDNCADFFFVLPFDLKKKMKALLNKISPAAILYARYDLWPNLVYLAAKKNIPQMVFCASNPPGSKRFRPPFGTFQKHIYQKLNCISTTEPHESTYFKSWHPGDVICHGDTRFDAINRRLNASSNDSNLLNSIRSAFPKDRKLLIAGSCYKTSIDFLTAFAAQNKSYALILVPHHPSEEIKEYAYLKASSHSLNFAVANEQLGKDIDVLLVNQYGVLLQLYRAADIVYVGGGFEGSIHTVIEPAAMGAPVFCGPAISVSNEAIQLANEKLLTVLEEPTSNAVAKALETIHQNREKITAGSTSYFQNRLGASKNILKYLRQNRWFGDSKGAVKIASES